MRLNPELQRYGWQELSWQRLLIAPALLATLYFLASHTPAAMEIIRHISRYGFLALVLIWGGGKAARCVTEEVAASTWDWQRLSSLSPIALTFGKTVGSAIYSWYAALLCLALYAWSSLQTGVPQEDVLHNCILLLEAGILCQTGALLASLISLQGNTARKNRYASLTFHVVGIIMALAPLWAFNENRNMDPTAESGDGAILWYSHYFSVAQFITTFSWIACLWVIIGICWQMRAQLRTHPSPLMWLAFTGFMLFICHGYTPGSAFSLFPTPASLVHDPFTVSLALLYSIAFIEYWDGLTWRRLLAHWKNNRKEAFIRLLPRWVVSLACCVIMLAYAYFTSTDTRLYLLLTQMAFALRDIAVLHVFRLPGKNTHAVASTLVTLAVLYLMLPWLAFIMHHGEWVKWLLPLSLNSYTPAPLAVGILQAALVAALAFWRWKQSWARNLSSLT